MHKKYQRLFAYLLGLILTMGLFSGVAMTVSAAPLPVGTIQFSDLLKPSIEQQPQSVKTTDGRTVKMTVVAKKKSGTDVLSYQWYYKDKGAEVFSLDDDTAGATYTVTMSQKTDGRQVYCIVLSKYGAKAQSDTATMTMAEAVKITQQPAAVQVAKGESFSVFVKASGDGLSYCWYYKNPGEAAFQKSAVTTAVNSATMDAAWDGRQIYCVVEDVYGNTAQSSTVTVSVEGHNHSCAATYTADSKGHWYQCSDCGEKVSYGTHDFANACDEDCSVCGHTRDAAHTYPDVFCSDGTNHWKECTGCGLKTAKAAHTPGAEATETNTQTCEVCGCVIAPAAENDSPVTEPTAPAEKTEDGVDAQMPEMGENQPGKALFWCICGVVVAVSAMLLLVFAARRKKDAEEW